MSDLQLFTIHDGEADWTVAHYSGEEAIASLKAWHEVGIEDGAEPLTIKKTWSRDESYTLSFPDGIEEPLPAGYVADHDADTVVATVEQWLLILGPGDMVGTTDEW